MHFQSILRIAVDTPNSAPIHTVNIPTNEIGCTNISQDVIVSQSTLASPNKIYQPINTK